uniref:Predicted protein n=1 Tax=Hordeum vulgare subsp. vulgare TaxID=112509 RepID=F2D7V7_HORVV|nr:predicted protein [Hordeum vulgare subsp. vulgare]
MVLGLLPVSPAYGVVFVDSQREAHVPPAPRPAQGRGRARGPAPSRAGTWPYPPAPGRGSARLSPPASGRDRPRPSPPAAALARPRPAAARRRDDHGLPTSPCRPRVAPCLWPPIRDSRRIPRATAPHAQPRPASQANAWQCSTGEIPTRTAREKEIENLISLQVLHSNTCGFTYY